VTPQRGRVLVVDDEEDLREMLAFVLSGAGFEVLTADSGLSAVELAKEHRFDLAISDLKMPGMNGVETLTALKQIDASMEVIIVTGYASEETAVECLKRGAYGYLRKPFELDELHALVDRAVERRLAASPPSTDAS
jgi:DNA-binding NtrC family response regulator